MQTVKLHYGQYFPHVKEDDVAKVHTQQRLHSVELKARNSCCMGILSSQHRLFWPQMYIVWWTCRNNWPSCIRLHGVSIHRIKKSAWQVWPIYTLGSQLYVCEKLVWKPLRPGYRYRTCNNLMLLYYTHGKLTVQPKWFQTHNSRKCAI